MKNILGECFRGVSSVTNPSISPLTIKYECLQLSQSITNGAQASKGETTSPILVFQATHHKRMPETLKCHQSKGSDCCPHHEMQIWSSEKMRRVSQMSTRKGGPTVLGRNPTTSFLTRTFKINAIGPGITAAAGTRLALQATFVIRNKFDSFR